MKPKLTDKDIRCAIRRLEKGGGTRAVAEEPGVIQRRIRGLQVERFHAAGAHAQRPADHDPFERNIPAAPDARGKPRA